MITFLWHDQVLFVLPVLGIIYLLIVIDAFTTRYVWRAYCRLCRTVSDAWKWYKGKKLYWVTENGQWDDSMNWSWTRRGAGGAGVPDLMTDAEVWSKAGKTTTVKSGHHACCGNLTLGGKGMIVWDAEAIAGGVNIR